MKSLLLLSICLFSMTSVFAFSENMADCGAAASELSKANVMHTLIASEPVESASREESSEI